MRGDWFPFRLITGRPEDGPPLDAMTRVKLYGAELRDGTRPCTASVLLQMGEPGPQWTLAAAQFDLLMRLWRAAPIGAGSLPPGPDSGYRGVALLCPAGDGWFAFRNVVMCKSPGFPPEYRVDIDRRFERALVDSAPEILVSHDQF